MNLLDLEISCNLYINGDPYSGNPLTGKVDKVGKQAIDILAATNPDNFTLELIAPSKVNVLDEDKSHIKQFELANIAFVLKNLGYINKYADVGMPDLDK